MGKRQSPVPSNFKLIFVGCLSLTLILIGISLVIAWNFQTPTKLQEEIANKCMTFANVGIGAIFGLVGGRVAK